MREDKKNHSCGICYPNWGHKAEKLLVQRIGEAMEELPRELEDWISENDSLGG
jgi:hypothetical protein